jgi:hypothetical protein
LIGPSITPSRCSRQNKDARALALALAAACELGADFGEHAGGAARGDRIVWSASGGAEVSQHGQHSAVIVGAVRKVELAEDAVHVLFHG